MSNNGFTQRGVRYVPDDEDIDLSTFSADTLIALTGILLKMGFDISSDNALCTELIRRGRCYVREKRWDRKSAGAER